VQVIYNWIDDDDDLDRGEGGFDADYDALVRGVACAGAKVEKKRRPNSMALPSSLRMVSIRE
jgi:hypothetical protein